MGIIQKKLKDAENLVDRDKQYVLNLLMPLERHADITLPKCEYVVRASIFGYKTSLKKIIYAIKTGKKVDNKSPREMIKELRTTDIERIRSSAKNILDFFDAE